MINSYIYSRKFVVVNAEGRVIADHSGGKRKRVSKRVSFQEPCQRRVAARPSDEELTRLEEAIFKKLPYRLEYLLYRRSSKDDRIADLLHFWKKNWRPTPLGDAVFVKSLTPVHEYDQEV